MKTRKLLPINQVRADIGSSAIDQKARTVRLTWGTTYPVTRSAWGERFSEVLSFENGHVDLSRLNGGPFLIDHENRVESTIGRIEKVWIENGEGRAIARIDTDARSEAVWAKIQSGTINSVSVGYRVDKYEIEERDGELPVYRATKWTPMEVSAVASPADPNSGIRSRTNNEYEVEITTRDNSEGTKMDKEKLKEEERVRSVEILKLIKDAGMPDQMAHDYIARGSSVEDVRTNVALFAKYQKEQAAAQIQSQTRVEVGTDEIDKKRAQLEGAILPRINPAFARDSQNSLNGYTFLRALESVLPRKMGETDSQYATRSMSSSDLPLLLAQVAEKALQKKYSTSEQTYRRWTAKGNLRNYKEARELRAGDFASLQERADGAEYKYGSFSEEQEVAQLADHGIIMKFTSQRLVNDDLGAIKRVTDSGGDEAARLENRLAYSALSTNKTMGDSIALYHADHGNLGTPGVFSATTFGEAFLKMRSQATVDGAHALNIPPKFLIVPPSLEASAMQFLAAISANVNSNVNIYSGSVELVVDAVLSDDKYYFVMDPARLAGVKVFHLEGQESPRVQTRENWADDTIELKLAHTVAAAPMDWRALFRNEIA